MFALQLTYGGSNPDAKISYRLSMFALQRTTRIYEVDSQTSYRLSMFALQPRNSFNLCLSLRRASVLISSSMSGVVKTA